MASEVNGQPSQPQILDYKTWFLRVSVHCEGCKKKVKKILSRVPGVHTVDIDIRQQRVMVFGNVEADTLIKKLLKSGKNAELWPEQPMQEEKKPSGKSNHSRIQGSADVAMQKEKTPLGKSKYREEQQGDHHHQESQKNREIAQVKLQQPIGEKKEANSTAVKVEAFKKPPTKKSEEKIDDFDVNVEQKSKENDGFVGANDKAVESNFKDSGGDNQKEEQSKSEGKKVDDCSATSQPRLEAERTGGGSDNIPHGEKGCGGGGGCDGENVGGCGVESGKNVKKKKSKGQNGNFTSKAGLATPSNGDRPANMDMESHYHHNGGPSISLISTNESLPRHLDHHHHHHDPPHGSHHYGHLPSPSYGLSYNTSYPTNTHTTAYYAPSPPANAYMYSYPGPEGHPPLSDPISYPPQPLDSFEMFSDENPNGCLVM